MNKKVKNETSIIVGSNTTDKSISAIMKEYIDSYLPYVYKETTKTKQLSRQLLLNHKYFSIITNTKNSIDKTSKWIDGFHVLSMVSANMFILTILFDMRYPSDDGSCVTYDNEDDCMYRKTIFNTYCDWHSSTSSCTFSKPTFDLVSVITLAWLQLIISVPIRTIIHCLFDNIIYAATSTTIEDQIKENQITSRSAVANRLIRRMSAGALSAVSLASRRMSSAVSGAIKDVRSLSMSIKSTITLQANFADLRYYYHHY